MLKRLDAHHAFIAGALSPSPDALTADVSGHYYITTTVTKFLEV
jgi:hypothetical protein